MELREESMQQVGDILRRELARMCAEGGNRPMNLAEMEDMVTFVGRHVCTQLMEDVVRENTARLGAEKKTAHTVGSPASRSAFVREN